MNEVIEVHPAILVLIAVLLLSQGSWMFYDASKRGENKWLWGLFGLLNVPTNLIIYLIVTRRVSKTKPCPHCQQRVKLNAKYCPNCGDKL